MGKKESGADPALPSESIQRSILVLRGCRVMLDFDLAPLYGVATKSLNRAVRRNIAKFPDDFMFELSAAEFDNLRFQSGTSKWGGRRYRPLVFTEQGVAMLSSVLRSERAVQVNIEIPEGPSFRFRSRSRIAGLPAASIHAAPGPAA
jgi:hypothetical protein